MIAKQLLKKIRAHRGPIIVEIQNFHDVFFVQAVKADILLQFAKFRDDDETGFDLGSEGYLFKVYPE